MAELAYNLTIEHKSNIIVPYDVLENVTTRTSMKAARLSRVIGPSFVKRAIDNLR